MSIQYLHIKPIITLGEVMMRLSPPANARFVQAQRFDRFFGGSEANVAACLSKLGLTTEHVTAFPNHDLGIAALNSLRAHGVGTTHIAFNEGRLGVYYMENGASLRSSRVIYDRFDSAFAKMDPSAVDWSAVMGNAQWFHYSGITPAISSHAARLCLDALKAAKQNNVITSGDINYRRNLWQYGKSAVDVMPALIELTDHVVAGTEDIANCTGIRGNDFADACARLKKSFSNVRTVSTTNRVSHSASFNELSAERWSDGKVVRSNKYTLSPIVDRIGGGDAFMAGLIYGDIVEKGDDYTIDFAAACSAWKHTVEGDVNICSVGEIESLMKGENTGKLLR